MFNIDIHEKKIKIFLIILLIVLVAVIVIFALKINQEINKRDASQPVAENKQTQNSEEPKIYTPEEIQEALSEKSPENSDYSKSAPLSQEQIQGALNKKAEADSGSKSLTPEEIQGALSKKAK